MRSGSRFLHKLTSLPSFGTKPVAFVNRYYAKKKEDPFNVEDYDFMFSDSDEPKFSKEDEGQIESLRKRTLIDEKEGDDLEKALNDLMYRGPTFELVRIHPKSQHFTELLKIYPDIVMRVEGSGGLIGAFTMQVGTLDEIIHIWEWDDIKERQLALEFLQRDPKYRHFCNEAASLITKESNSIWSLATPNIFNNFKDENKKEPSQQGVYELEWISDPEEEEREETRSIRKSAGGFLVSSWKNMVDDPLKMSINLWRFDSLFEYDNFITSVGEKQIILPHTELLYPTLYSPLQ